MSLGGILGPAPVHVFPPERFGNRIFDIDMGHIESAYRPGSAHQNHPTSDGQTVGLVLDRSGYGNHMQATFGLEPTFDSSFTPNGGAGLVFNGTTQHMDNPAAILRSHKGFALYAVMASDLNIFSNPFAFSSEVDVNASLSTSGFKCTKFGRWAVVHNENAADPLAAQALEGAPAYTVPQIVTMTIDRTTTPYEGTVRVNGGYKNSDTFDETTEFNIVHARFGADTEPNLGYCAVTIHRVLIFDEPHNAAQVNEVLAVLSRQTGIQVEVAT